MIKSSDNNFLNKIVSDCTILYKRENKWTNDLLDLYNRINRLVNQLDSFNVQNISLEQYTLPDSLISFILTEISDELKNKTIIELGSGTGRFSIPIGQFFAKNLLCIDINYNLIEDLKLRMNTYNLTIDYLVSSVDFLEFNEKSSEFDIAIMNPPFGTKRRGIDMVFVEKAFSFSKCVISMHKSNLKSKKLINILAKENSFSMEVIATVEFQLPKTAAFHKKNIHKVLIDIYKFSAIN